MATQWWHVALFVPNLIGCLRMALCVLGVQRHLDGAHQSFVFLYMASTGLDLVDGVAARKLRQTSSFGAFFDVVQDNVTRAVLWLCLLDKHIVPLPLVAGATLVEAFTFVAAHASSRRASRHWKEQTALGPASFLKHLFANNFKNPIGFAAIFGGFYYPLHLYGQALTPDLYLSLAFGNQAAIDAWGAFLLAGRIVALGAEVVVIGTYVYVMLVEDALERDAALVSAGDNAVTTTVTSRAAHAARSSLRRRSRTPAPKR